MNNIPEANLVTQSIFDELQLSNDNNLYGDLFYFLKGGFTFTHTIHGFGFKTNSMHGYHPQDQGNEGAFVSNKKINVTRAFLPDVFHTTIHALDIDYSPKILLDGRDILAS